MAEDANQKRKRKKTNADQLIPEPPSGGGANKGKARTVDYVGTDL